MNRILEQRGNLSLLLAGPAKGTCDGATDVVQRNRMRSLTAALGDGNATHFPAYELKELFSALAEECRADSPPSGIHNDTTQSVRIDRRPRKRGRTSPNNNNAHSILRFVERIIGQRYKKKPKSKYDNDRFLEDELKKHFGTDDVLFQAEEEILSSAFRMAVDVIMQHSDVGVDNGHQNSSNEEESSGGQPNRIYGRIGKDCVIQTALRVIDQVILIDKRERAVRTQLQQSTKPKMQRVSQATFSDRRKKYQHLLANKKQPNNGGRKRSIENVEATCEVKSIMEEKYPRKWEWLQEFRRKYEASSKGTIELQSSHYPNPTTEEVPKVDETTSNYSVPPLLDDKDKGSGSNFVVIRRRIETLDDISLSSTESDEEMNDESDMKQAKDLFNDKDNTHKSDSAHTQVNTAASQPESEIPPPSLNAPTSPKATALSPYDKLDKETNELRVALLDMPPSESSSTDVVRHTVGEIENLLARYGELDGAGGISRCGDILGGNRAINSDTSKMEQGNAKSQFPLNDDMVSSLVKAFLTDATGGVRAKAFLRAFVLPLVTKMNPVAGAVTIESNVDKQKGSKDQGKPASRVLTSLLTTLARDRPTECVVSVLVPSLVLAKYNPSAPAALEASFEPTRFQCELISRVLRGKDALSIPAITLLIEEVLPTNKETIANDPTVGSGMKWTEHSMPILTACLNRQPTLPDSVVVKLADEISYHLSPTAPAAMLKSMKFSTLFHALVTKYGPQVKSTGRVESLKDSASRLKTFMSKTIGLALKKLS